MSAISDSRKSAWLFAIAIMIVSCKTTGLSFNGPHDFSNIRATVVLNDQSTLSGSLSLTMNEHEESAGIILNKQRTTLTLNPKQIASFKTDMGDFYLKKLHPVKSTNPFTNSSSFTAYVKQVSAPDGFIGIYEYNEKTAQPKSPLPKFVNQYYVSLPGNDKEIWHIESEKFSKGFNDTMIKYFEEDQPLIEKIKNKEPGFYYKPYSFASDNKIKILMNLINYYHRHRK